MTCGVRGSCHYAGLGRGWTSSIEAVLQIRQRPLSRLRRSETRYGPSSCQACCSSALLPGSGCNRTRGRGMNHRGRRVRRRCGALRVDPRFRSLGHVPIGAPAVRRPFPDVAGGVEEPEPVWAKGSNGRSAQVAVVPGVAGWKASLPDARRSPTICNIVRLAVFVDAQPPAMSRPANASSWAQGERRQVRGPSRALPTWIRGVRVDARGRNGWLTVQHIGTVAAYRPRFRRS